MSLLPRMRTWYINYGFLIVGLVLVNLGVLNWYLWTKKSQPEVTDTRKEEVVQQIANPTNCDADCVNQIVDSKLKLLPTPSSVSQQTTPTPTPTTKVINKAVPTPTPVARTEYVNLADGVADATTDWVNLPISKWLDTSLYGTLVSASWQGWIEMPGGSGTGYARLYDATNARAVDGSEIRVTETERTSFFSGDVSLWRGQNQYFIQVRSTGGGTVKVNGARIKLVVR